MEALKPEAYDDVRAIWHPDVEKKTGIDLEDQAYASLANSRGWKFLHQYLNTLKIGLDKRLAESVLKGLSDAQIKNDALFAVLGKELIDSIINKVEDSSEVVESIKNGKRPE